ncbi:MAG: hypothetical protein PVJ78_10440, partial [Gammaproteobacteria bacterium]
TEGTAFEFAEIEFAGSRTAAIHGYRQSRSIGKRQPAKDSMNNSSNKRRRALSRAPRMETRRQQAYNSGFARGEGR